MKTRATLLEEALDAAKELINECFDTTQETIFQHGLERLDKALAALEAAKEEPQDCPNCDNAGWYMVPDSDGEPTPEQCQWCYTMTNSKFNKHQKDEPDTVTRPTNKQINDAADQCLREQYPIKDTITLPRDFGVRLLNHYEWLDSDYLDLKAALQQPTKPV